MGTMTRAEYDVAVNEQQRRHEAELESLKQRAEKLALKTAKAEFKTAWRRFSPRLHPAAEDDVTQLVFANIGVSDDGSGGVVVVDKTTGRPADFDALLRAEVASKPFLEDRGRTPNPDISGEGSIEWLMRPENLKALEAVQAQNPQQFAKDFADYKESKFGRSASGPGVSPDARVERAKRDLPFMEQWQQRDSAGFKRAWSEELERVQLASGSHPTTVQKFGGQG